MENQFVESVNTAVSSVGSSFTEVWINIFSAIPSILGAIFIILFGFFIAHLAKHAIIKLFQVVKLDNLLSKTALDDIVRRAGYKLNSGAFIGTIVYWFMAIVFLLPAFDIMKLTALNTFIKDQVLTVIPEIVVAILIIFLGSVLADFFGKLVKGSVKATGHGNGETVGAIAKWSIMGLAVIGAFQEVNILSGILNPLIIAFFAFLAIAGGVAFGFGARDAAKRMVEKLEKEVVGK